MEEPSELLVAVESELEVIDPEAMLSLEQEFLTVQFCAFHHFLSI